MAVSSSKAALVFVALLFACAWHMTHADPFIPTGANPGGSNDEQRLFNISRGFVWRAPSLLYLYVAIPNASFPENESLWETTQKAIFFPPVDKLSKLTIPGTYAAYSANSSLTVSPIMWASGFGLNSTQKQYVSKGASTYTVGAYQLVIEMDKGVVSALTWIEGCGECSKCPASSANSLTCQSDVCITNQCTIEAGDCTNLAADQCDMKVYVAWVGSDAHGRQSTSSGSLPYNFVQFGLSPAYRAAAGVDKQYLFSLSFLTGNSDAASIKAHGPVSLLLIALFAIVFAL